MKVFCFLLIALPTLVTGQTDTVFVKRMDIMRGIDVIGYTFTSPARWKGKDWLTLGGVVATTAAITLLDEPINDYLRGKDCQFFDGLERVGYHYGKPYSAIALTGGLYLTGVIINDEWAKETGLMLASGLTTSTII